MDPDSKRLYSRFLGHTRPYWTIFVVSIFATIIIGVTEPDVPAIMGQMLNGSFAENNTDLALYYSLMLMCFFLIRGLAQYTSTTAMSWVGIKVIMDMHEAMFSKLLDTPNQLYEH
ncbi:MAG: ABC transporter transmembrane domain-containing protein [Candidatus Thiodiazotropha sp.]